MIPKITSPEHVEHITALIVLDLGERHFNTNSPVTVDLETLTGTAEIANPSDGLIYEVTVRPLRWLP